MTAEFSEYADVVGYLYRLGLFHMDLGLDRMNLFLDRNNSRKLDYPSIHVVGTNGKGSVSTMLESLLRSAGCSTGLFTSPHFLSPRERLRLNGVSIPEEAMLAAANRVMDIGRDIGLTYFEFLTALGVVAFGQHVDVGIYEAGLGGTFDAAGAMQHDFLVFTPVAMDHESVLGNTIEQIATDKAGAMKKGQHVFMGPQDEAVATIISKRAEAVGATLHHVSCDNLPEVGLAGKHQQENASLAVAVFRFFCEEQGRSVSEDMIRQALQAAFIAGRFQQIGSEDGLEIILDGAHNEHSLSALCSVLREKGCIPCSVIFSCMRDKNVEELIPMVLGLTAGPVFVPGIAENERAIDPNLLANKMGARAMACSDMAEALERAEHHGKPVLVCGSLYLLAEFYKLRPEFVDPSSPVRS